METQENHLIRQSCISCHKMLPRDEAHFKVQTTPKGKQRLSSVCLSCAPAEEQPKTTKKCPNCERELPANLDHFYRHDASLSGLSSWCKDCTKANSQDRYRKEKTARPSKSIRDPWDFNKHGFLTPEIQANFDKTGKVPPGFYACRRCGAVKPNTFQYFSRQSSRYLNMDGSRKFTTVCRHCLNLSKRRANHRRQHEKEMAKIHLNEEWTPDTEADVRKWAQLPPEEQENW